MPKVKCAYCNKDADNSKMYRCDPCARWMCSDCIESGTFISAYSKKCPKCKSNVEKG